MALFKDRRDAGRQLARLLVNYAGRSDVLVLALPRGGLPVAAEVAAALQAPLDVFLVRKIGVPFQPELAMGAIAEGGVTVLNHALIRDLDIPDAAVEHVSARERLELDRRSRAFRGSRRSPAMDGRTVILIDDGLATGSTMEAAVTALRARQPVTHRDRRPRRRPRHLRPAGPAWPMNSWPWPRPNRFRLSASGTTTSRKRRTRRRWIS